jgi:peptidoglycan/LPS O-acetylase OafA/YrhL|tara:strand:+ start:444 stop:1472 length:1029 start_codon:yes stop_codon:yes gene_type:complete
MKTTKYKRLESVDFLRGIAVISVVFYHLTHTKGFLDSEGLVYNMFKDAGEFGVSVFFVISGYVIPYSMFKSGYKVSNFKAFFFKRIIRIEPVFILSIFFTASIYILLSRGPEIYWNYIPYKVDFTNFVLHIGYLISFVPNENWINPVYWSLGIEFQYYLVIGLIFPFFILKKKIFNTISLFLITAICWFIFFNFVKDTYLHYGRLLFRFFPIFLVGISLFQLKEKLLDKYSFVIFNSSIILLCWTEFKPRVIVAILFALIILFLMKKSPKFFLFLGKISFSMYLVHVPIGGAIGKLIIPHFQDDGIRTILILLSMVPIIGISWLFYEFIEEPCIRLSKRIKY